MNPDEVIESISHDAVVLSVDEKNGIVNLQIEDSTECESCAASRLCAKVNAQSKKMSIKDSDASRCLKSGDKVELEGTEQMHRKAIMLATVFPCITLIVVMVVVYIVTLDQLTAAVSGLGITILFFAALYLCRNKIAHEFMFKIKKR